jgi:hypothetical protein
MAMPLPEPTHRKTRPEHIVEVSSRYLVADTGNYNLPFIPMAILLAIGVAFWLIVDLTQQLTPPA